MGAVKTGEEGGVVSFWGREGICLSAVRTGFVHKNTETKDKGRDLDNLEII